MPAYILVQNYSNLNLTSMILRADSAGYVISCNNGGVYITGCTIVGTRNALDMCWAPNVGYPNGTQITVVNSDITGNIQLDVWGTMATPINSTIRLYNTSCDLSGKIDVYSPELIDQITLDEGYMLQQDNNTLYNIVKIESEITPDSDPVDTTDTDEIEVGIDPEDEADVNEILTESATKNEEVLAAIEEGKEITVKLEINKIDGEDVPESDINKIKDFIGNTENILQYFNADVIVNADNEFLTKLTELTDKVTITIVVPDEYLAKNRKFYVIRIHNGKVERVEAELDGNLLKCATDKFSIYAVSYVDEKDKKDETPDTGSIDLISYAYLTATLSGTALIIELKKKIK